MKTFKILLAAAVVFSALSCKKFIEVGNPRTEIAVETVFSSDLTAISAMRGIYAQMMETTNYASGYTDYFAGLSADELTNYSTDQEQATFFTHRLLTTNGNVSEAFWKPAYRHIIGVNMLLEGIAASGKLSPAVRKQLEGEGRLLRAFSHFYLVNLFGGVPYVTATDYRINGSVSRMPVAEVYRKIEMDLEAAVQLLADDYAFSDNDRAVPNKWAAIALLSRVKLYQGKWAEAETLAASVIANSALYGLEDGLDKVFLKNSREAIWQLQPVIAGLNTWQSLYFIFYDIPTYGVAVSEELKASFEPGDLRRQHWTATTGTGPVYTYPYKYKVEFGDLSEYEMVIRLAELYLIRAEAKVQQDRIAEGIADLNLVRERATDTSLPLGDPGRLVQLPTNLTKADALLKVEHERRVELFVEWGHRWLDLKRTGRATAVLGPYKGANWKPEAQLYPIPQGERLINPNLTQNPGY